MNPIIKRIGKFTITVEGTTEHDCRYKVSITPGDKKIRSFDDTRWIHIKCTVHFLHSIDAAKYQRAVFIRYARNETNYRIWDRLNHAPHELYKRFQRFVARNHKGKWVRGINIYQGKVKLNFE